MSKVRDILGTDKESEFLQSFVRVGLASDQEDNEQHKSLYMQPKVPPIAKQSSEIRSEGSDGRSPTRARTSPRDNNRTRRGRRRDFYEEMYTDKDRAAAVSYGCFTSFQQNQLMLINFMTTDNNCDFLHPTGYFDIKQSLSIKRRQDRSEALQLPDETDPSTLLALGQREFKSGNTDIAILFISKALELNPSDQNALVARSKCYLLLGDPSKGLQDAETALQSDKNNIRAIYQKAEALYFLGQFELSLMYFHRGLRIRPELNSFRLGVQKTQEAIEKTIGGFENQKQIDTRRPSVASIRRFSIQPSGDEKQRPITGVKAAKASVEKREARKLLGELCVDKEYLENLLTHPDLKRADTGTEQVSSLVNDAVRFLNTRQEFWRQQRPCTALPKQKKTEITVPKW